jgi:hypothetical protein
MFDHIVLPSHAQIREKLGRYSIQFDAASFYDQFLFSKDVRRLFCVKTPRGILAYRTLPMGFRISCAIAQLTIEALLSFHMPSSVSSFGYIDNVLLTGDNLDELLRAASEFRARCQEVGVILNDPDIPLMDLVSQEFDFLGEHYDCRSWDKRCWTRSNTSKTVEKLEAAADVLRSDRRYTFRQLAAVYGILLYAHNVVDARPARFFNALRFYRTLEVHASGRWNALAPPLPLVVKNELMQWLSEAAANRPQALRTEVPSADATIFVDASEQGWGALVVTPDGSHTIGGPWSDADWATWNLSSSVAAEPLALRRAVMSVATTTTRHLLIYSDHQPLAWAFATGYAKAFSYNEAVRQLRDMFPQLRVTARYIPGDLNRTADAISRCWGPQDPDGGFTLTSQNRG